MRNSSFNDPACSAIVKQELLRGISEVLALDKNRPLIEYIISNAMFPA